MSERILRLLVPCAIGIASGLYIFGPALRAEADRLKATKEAATPAPTAYQLGDPATSSKDAGNPSRGV